MSFDDFAILLIANALIQNNDEAAIHEFGQALDKYLKAGKRVIVDGQFVNVVSRSALLKTLQNANYTIYVISFLNMPNELVEERIASRAVDNTVSDILCRLPDYNPDPGNVGIPKKRALAFIKSKGAYRDYLGKEYSFRVNELINSNVLFQIQQDVFIYGCDYYYDLF